MACGAEDLFRIQNDPEYRNWHAVGDALMFLGDGLRKYAENKMKEFHALITANVGGPTVKCSCKCTLGMKSNPHRGATTCIWAQKIKNSHVFKRKADIPWHQSDSSKWHDPVSGYWEIAKLFMSDLGLDPAKVTDANSTDVGPLLNLIRFCKHFKVQRHLLKAVTDRRNQWAHAPNHRLSDGDKKSVFQDIKLLMNDPELLTSKEVQDCKPTINKLEAMDILVLEENQLRLMEEYRRIKECENLQIKERLDAANEEIKERKIANSLLSKSMVILSSLLFVVLLPWRTVPSLLQWCLAVFFISAQVGDRTVMVHDEGNKMNFNVTIIYVYVK